MNTLKSIQTLAKIGRVISKIIFVFCIVGFCFCVVGIASLALGAETLKLGGVTIHGLIEKKPELSLPTLYAVMAVSAVACLAEAVLCRFAEHYFKNELAEGTPFTHRGAKELLRLGILTIVIPLCTGIVCAIGVAIADSFYPGLEKLSMGEYSSVSLGVMMIVLSLFCRYGAECNDSKRDA